MGFYLYCICNRDRTESVSHTAGTCVHNFLRKTLRKIQESFERTVH